MIVTPDRRADIQAPARTVRISPKDPAVARIDAYDVITHGRHKLVLPIQTDQDRRGGRIAEFLHGPPGRRARFLVERHEGMTLAPHLHDHEFFVSDGARGVTP